MRKSAVVMAILVTTAAAAGGLLMFQRHRTVSPPPHPVAQEPPQESSAAATLPPERFAARLVIRTAKEERPVHLYVGEVLQGTAPLAEEIYIEEGEYVIRAVVFSEHRAPFFIVEKKIAVGAGERRVVDFEVPTLPFESTARPLEPRYVPACSVGFGDVLVGSPDDPDPVVPHIRALQKLGRNMQNDQLLTFAASVEQAFRNAPPATARLLFPRIPVWSYDGRGNAVTSHLDLELDAAQVARLGRWVEVTRYGLDEYQARIEDTHRLLTIRQQWAVNCGHGDYVRLLQPRIDHAQRAIESARALRQQISTTFASIASSLEAAAQ